MGKMKIYLLVGGLLITILSTYICYSIGWANGFTDSCKLAGYTEGYHEAISVPDETAFIDGCNNGIKEIVKSVCNPRNENQSFRKITFQELVTFLRSDKTDEILYSDNFTCSGYALTLKKNANIQGIACAFVVLNYKNNSTGKTDSGHTINAFDIDGGPLPKIEGFTDDEIERAQQAFFLGLEDWVIMPDNEPGRLPLSPLRKLSPEQSKTLTDYLDATLGN